METGYCQLKQKEVVNIKDGRKLGRVTDVVFTFPEGKTLGVVVPGGRGFFRPGMFIDLRNIVKIGEDIVLVEVRPSPKTVPPKRGHGYIGRGDDFSHDNDCDHDNDRDDCDRYGNRDCKPKPDCRRFDDDE